MKQLYLKTLVLLLLCMAGTNAFAYDCEVGGIYYNLDRVYKTASVTYQKTFSVASYSGTINIPQKITYSGQTYSVTSIGRNAFSVCTGLTSITIPESVTSIGSSAFRKCTGLTSITIPSSVTSIDGNPFTGCSGLETILVESENSVYDSRGNCNAIIKTENNELISGCKTTVIPNSVTSIGRSAFYGCTGLTNITIPESVTSIGSSAFSGCTGLTSVTIPESVTSIGESSFEGCTGLTSITIPESVTTIGDYAFRDCTGLTSITIPESVTSIGGSVFSGCSGLKAISVESKNSIYDSRGNCNAIIKTENNELISGCKTTVIPNSVTSIGRSAFYGCTGLTNITIPESVTSIGSSAFSGCTGLTSITIPNSVTAIGSSTFYGCTGLTSITIPNSVTSIGDYAFRGCTGLTSITIPNSITDIATKAFDGCTGLIHVTLNNHSIVSKKYTSTSTISNIFGNQVKEYILGNEVEAIGEYAFSGCNELTTITIPSSVKSIGNNAFDSCEGLTSVRIDDIAAWCGISFQNDKSNPLTYAHCLYLNEEEIKDLVIPNGVTSISYNAFLGCTSLTSITIPNSVTTIESYAFSGCTDLTSITIPNSVTSIGSYVFSGCTGLTSITIPNSVKSIGSYIFSGSQVILNNNAIASKDYSSSSALSNIFGSQVREYVLGDEVKSIGEWAFYKSTNLSSVFIPMSVTTIGSLAFDGCSNLTQVTLNSNSIVSKDYSSVSNIFGNQVKKYIIGNDVESIGMYKFSESTALASITIGSNVEKISNDAFFKCTNLTELIVNEGNMVYDSRGNCNAIIETANNSLILGCKATTIPNSVTSIGSSAFSNCTGLTNIDIPNSVTSIGSSAFSGCTGLTSITITNSVTTIGNSAFYNCTGLTNITIPNSVTTIGNSAFYNCTGLTNIDIPNSVTSIDSYAFSNCTDLTSVSIGSGVLKIADNSFYDCNSLTSLTVDVNNKAYDSRDNCNALIETASNTLIKGSKNTVIPNSVTKIGYYAFKGYTDLKTISIPDHVTDIAAWAFEGCTGLTSITIPNSVTYIGTDAFKGCTGINTVTLNSNRIVSQSRKSSESLGAVFGSQVKIYILGEGVTGIGNYAFYNCAKLTDVTIPESVTMIGDNAFENCYMLTEVSIPYGIKSIGDYAFYNCYLNDVYCRAVVCPETGKSAFSYQSRLHVPRMSLNAYRNTEPWSNFSQFLACYDIEVDGIYYFLNQEDNTAEVTYNDRGNSASYVGELNILQAVSYMDKSYVVTRIGETSFYGCTGITSVTIPDGVKEISLNAFGNCRNITTVYLNSNDVVSLNRTDGEWLENGRKESNLLSRIFGSQVNSYVLGDRVTSIGERAFAKCSNLASINIPEKVNSIGTGAFTNCVNLTSINIPDKVRNIGADAFLNCSGITSVKITDVDAWCKIAFGNAMANPLYYAHQLFLGDSVVENVAFPSVTDVSDYAFIGCSDLASVTLPNTVLSIGQGAFSGCQNLKKVIFGSGVKTIGSFAFIGCSKLESCILPNGTEAIGEYAFSNCSALQDVVIPNTVTSIGKYAFENCLGLYSVTSLVNIPFKLDETAFAYTGTDYDTEIIYGVAKLYVPTGRDGVYRVTTGWKKFMNIIETDTKFKLTYMLDGKEYKTYEIQATEVITPEPDPYKKGYIFSGWSDIPYLMPAHDVTIEGSFTIDPEYYASVEGITQGKVLPDAYYSVSGRKQDKMQRGLNIIRMSDGTVRKVMVRSATK